MVNNIPGLKTRNNAHRCYQLYPTQCDLHSYFTWIMTSCSPCAIHTECGITCIFEGMFSYLSIICTAAYSA